MLKKENSTLVRDIEDIQRHRDQLKHLVEKKDKEIERGRSRITNLSVELQDAQIKIQDKDNKIRKLELVVETKNLDVLKIQRDFEKYQEMVNKMDIWEGMEDGRDDVELFGETMKENTEKGTKNTENQAGNTDGTEDVGSHGDTIKEDKEKGTKKMESLYQSGQGKTEIKNCMTISSSSDEGKEQEVHQLKKNEDAKQEGEVENSFVKESSKSKVVEGSIDNQMNIVENEINGHKDLSNIRKTDEKDEQIDFENMDAAVDASVDATVEKQETNADQKVDINTNNLEIQHGETFEKATNTIDIHEEKNEEKRESTLEELMSLLIESLRTTKSMGVVQNLNQLIVVTKDSQIAHETNVEETQTMEITQVSYQINFILLQFSTAL